MTITSITRDWGPKPSIVRIVTDDSLENIIRGGWLATQAESIIAANNGEFQWEDGDAVLVQYPTGNINLTTGREIQGVVLTYVFPSFLSLNAIGPIYNTNVGSVAHAGGGQADATQLSVGVQVVSVVATAGDSVRLPNDVLGQTVIMINLGANSLNVFPYPGDSIDAIATDGAYALAANSRVIFIGTNVLKWNSFALATGSA